MKKQKRVTAGFLAMVILFVTIFTGLSPNLTSRAASFHGKNLWKGGSEIMFGKSRNYLFRWEDGYQTTFCIDPGHKMNGDVVSYADRYNINDDFPYIESKESFAKLALVCDWYDTKAGSIWASNASYAAAQGAVWAISTEVGWEGADALIATIDKHVPGTNARWAVLKEYVNSASVGSGSSLLPDWCSTMPEMQYQTMKLIDGVYRVDLDISKFPELANVPWKFPNSDWSKSVSGNILTISYKGIEKPQNITISGTAPAAVAGSVEKNSENLNIYAPIREIDQAMISAGLKPTGGILYINLRTEEYPVIDMSFQTYVHNETFESTYNIDLKKYCAETGQRLEGSIFSVLELFEDNQLGGLVTKGNMSPSPVTWNGFRECAQVSTDINGQWKHTDKKYYDYSKTYCKGHPEPKYLDVPGLEVDPATGGDNSDEIASIEAENERLREEWEAYIELCEQEIDFHSVDDGVGLEMMLEDRDNTYEEFIDLKYVYTVKEVQARYGYILHGQHNDDEKIPVVRIQSSEAGGGYEAADEYATATTKYEVPLTQAKTVKERAAISILSDVTTDSAFSLKDREIQRPQRATGSNALLKSSDSDAADLLDLMQMEADGEGEYRYILKPRMFDLTHNYVQIIASPSNAEAYRIQSRADAGGESISLPEPEEDTEDSVNPKESGNISYTWEVNDRRTEGEAHINKRDLELSDQDTSADQKDSYGNTQGDGTLEGALYGLYAAADIVHPDGKTGIVYKTNDLVALATTDINGDASFLAITEDSPAANLSGTWIGHPLILGDYYIKEIGRSEGYELSIYGKNLPDTNRGSTEDAFPMAVGSASAGSLSHPIDMHDGSWLEFNVTYQDTEKGYDVVVTGYPEGSTFEKSELKENTTIDRVVVGTIQVPTGEYEKAAAGEKKLDRDGNYIPVLDASGKQIEDINAPVSGTYGLYYRLNTYPSGTAVPADPVKWADTLSVDTDYIKTEVNGMLKKIGFKALDDTDGDGAPWITVELTGTTNQQIGEEILDWYVKNSFWDSAQVQSVILDGGKYKAVLFYDYKAIKGDAIYDAVHKTTYVRKTVTVDGGASESHIFVSYPEGDFKLKGALVSVTPDVSITEDIPFLGDITSYVKKQYQPMYATYNDGDYRLDKDGNKIPILKTEFVYGDEEQTITEYHLEPITAVYDASTKSYRLHIDNTDDWTVSAPKMATIRATAPQKTITIDGEEMLYADYLTQIVGVGAAAYASKEDTAPGSYLISRQLTYPGQIPVFQDGGTRLTPDKTQERAIKQKIKVVKNIAQNDEKQYDNNTNKIHEDWFTTTFGGYFDRLTGNQVPAVAWMDNFRFKVYLKTNLEGIYRNENGDISWLDREGNVVDITGYKAAFPEEVQKIYTKVLHSADIYKDSKDAITTNTQLYSYSGDVINADQNTGYTRILETISKEITDKDDVKHRVDTYNYEKFFAAIYAANTDKWKNAGAVTNTSFKPLPGNTINTSEMAKANARASDVERQFAIDWYLQDEVKKQVGDNPAGEKEPASGNSQYSDEVYDKALYEALKKTVNYLKPFYSYDLDSIYSIEWDSEADGGKDKDTTTLSADALQSDGENSYYYGVSRYLAYGTYVLVEQQPEYAALNDFPNKHYEIDKPREIVLPSLYEGGGTGTYDKKYTYDSTKTPAQLLADYNIRFNEEWAASETGNTKEYVINAHNNDGDFKIYKYGLDIDKTAQHFKLTQGEYNPIKDYYHFQADGTNDYYLANGEVSKYYRYASVSEQSGTAAQVVIPGAGSVSVLENVKTMQGMQTAYEGGYAHALVPWTVTEPAASNIYDPDAFSGYADSRFTNRFYTATLRLEKLDAETGENVLHEDAIFAIYSAQRNDTDTGDGEVKCYEKDTMIHGSKEFVTAMGARDITSTIRAIGTADAGATYTGIVPAGTPICTEDEQIILTDTSGNRTGQFSAFTTDRDGDQAGETANQVTGYIETPQPLGAGVYVILEISPTSGYARTKPVAVEVYSDRVTYYLDGGDGNKVASTIYKSQEGQETARIYLNNTAVRLEINKIKTTDTTATYEAGSRIEGTEIQLQKKYGTDLEYAYNHSGKYLGYGWKKGTLEYLLSRKEAGEAVEIVYQDGIFAGYGRITRALESPADQNQNVTGAKMTLYDAIEIERNNNAGDFGYDGVTVSRDRNSNVTNIQVEKGYAGEQVLFTKEKADQDYTYTDKINDTGAGTWGYKTVQRGTTDILFYSLSGLSFSEADASGTVMGYDSTGNKVALKNQSSIFALKNGKPTYELTGSRLDQIRYSATDKTFTGQDADVIMYHLDENGIRDAMVDMVTGMAYLEQNGTILTWAVNTAATGNGAVIARDKIQTYRIATFGADTDTEYVTGTLEGNQFKKSLDPTLNIFGLPVYYQKSGETYTKGEDIYDIDGDYVRYKYFDLLPNINMAAYQINALSGLTDPGKQLLHRQGESYIMANTWMTGEKYPNDPLKSDMTVGQADMLKRVIPGNYILEEVAPPAGYAKGFPQVITVDETAAAQPVDVENENIKVEITKTDTPETYKLTIQSEDAEDAAYTEGKGSYSHSQVVGSHLVMYKARQVWTTDTQAYPAGYYLEKVGNAPASWTVENPADNTPVTVTADWITDGTPKYFEGIPAGFYILEELSAASGYLKNRMEIEVRPTGEVQSFDLQDDHTKLEIYKYYVDGAGKEDLMPNKNAAGLTVYEAVSDADGNIVYENGLPKYDDTRILDSWETDDLIQYTGETIRSTKLADRFLGLFSPKGNVSSFILDFEASYKNDPNISSMTWLTADGERSATLTDSKTQGSTGSKVQLWRTDGGDTLRITIYQTTRSGSLQNVFEYQFNYRELADGVKAYETLEGMHRIDYVPFNAAKDGKAVGNYVLVEHKTPDGFVTAEPKALVITETGNVQRYSLENEETYIHVDKFGLKPEADGTMTEYQIPGVVLGLYEAAGDGSYTDAEDALVETWTTGADGRYTEADKLDGKILRGYEPGDYKPHRISKIAYGRYYIAELDVPDYMAKNAPQLVEVKADNVPAFKVVNHLSVGKLQIHKTAADTGKDLMGARFEVKNESTKESWIITSGEDGTAALDHMAVGTLQPDGTIAPYWFQVKEITPPDHYQAEPLVKRFQFDGSGNTETLTYGYEVKNQPTSVAFTKTNFSNDMLIEGATVAIYKAKLLDGVFVKDGDAIETIQTGSQGFTITGKLIASHSYIAQELEAPAGLLLAKPLVFTLNASGSGLSRIANDFSIITLNASDQVIESMSVAGRVATGVVVTLKDVDTKNVITVPGTEGDVVLTAADGLKDGNIYEITESTVYSDGNTEVTRKETKRITLDENGGYKLPSRTFKKTVETLTDSQGNVIDSWIPEGDSPSHTIYNPITAEPSFLAVIGDTGRDSEAVQKGKLIKYQIHYKNTSSSTQDATIQAFLDEGLELIRTTPEAAGNGQNVAWTIDNALPGREEIFEVVAVVTGAAGSETSMRAEIDGKSCIRKNPVADKHTLTIKNVLSGTGAEEADVFTYRVTLKDAKGNVLKGYYAYEGTTSGRIKGEGDIALSGSGYVTFSELPNGTQYEVKQTPTYGYALTTATVTGAIGDIPSTAGFKNHQDDETVRDMLIKNGEYVLSEVTEYTDGSILDTGKYRFVINDNLVVDNIDMLDKPIEVIFSKRDITSEDEITGGRYQLIEPETGAVLHEFTKDSEIKLPGTLFEPGKEYILREIEAPQGYAYARDIYFTVSGSGVPELVVMYDEQTQIQVIKVNESGKLLTGSKHQILDANKKVVIPEFVFDGKPFDITGKLNADTVYYLRETQAPAGYLIAGDVEFTVPREPGIVTVTMVDPRKPSTPSEPEPYMHLKKIDAENKNGLAGFEFTIYTEDGSLYKTVITGADGYARFPMPADGIYTYEESKAIDGYLLPEEGTSFTFTIKNRAVEAQSTVVVENHKAPDIPVKKISSKTDEALEGAILRVADQEGTVVFTSATGADGYMMFRPGRAGAYTISEDTAPEGYVRTDKVLTVTVHQDGTYTGDLTLQNSPEEKKKGYIIAKYGSKLHGIGEASVPGSGIWGFYGRIPRTGDTSEASNVLPVLLCMMFATGLIGSTGLYLFRRKKRNDKRA